MTAGQVHCGLSYARYCELPGVRSSTLNAILDCPARARYALDHDSVPTPDMALGTALHAILLSGEKYAITPDCPKNTKAGKAEWEAFFGSLDGHHVLTPAQAGMVEPMRKALADNPIAADVRASGIVELSITWTDAITSLPCKARIDAVGECAGTTIVLDLKTTRRASPAAFGRNAASYGYHVQAAHYLAAMNAVAPMKRRFVFACIEKEPPYILALNELDGESLEYAEERRRHALWAYYDCEQSGNWGAYGSGVNMCRLPPWELMRGREDDE